MSVLVLAELSDGQIAPATRNAVTAAVQIDSDVHLLVAGEGCADAAAAGGQIAGITKVLHADDAVYANGLAENVAKLVAGLAASYSHVLATATNQGKNVMPRAAALLDVHADLGDHRGRRCRHLRAPDLCRQRASHGQIVGQRQDHHRPRHGLRCSAGNRWFRRG